MHPLHCYLILQMKYVNTQIRKNFSCQKLTLMRIIHTKTTTSICYDIINGCNLQSATRGDAAKWPSFLLEYIFFLMDIT